MRAVFSGSITFGLVSVPVKAYSAVEDHDVAFHQVHADDGGRIRYQRTCAVCGKKVEYADIDKAYSQGDETVVITAEELKALPEAEDHDIEVVQFVPSDQVDPIMLERSYFLEPDGKAAKPYRLLRQTLQDTDRTAIVTFSMRQKTRLGALRVREDVLVLQGLLWADEVREVGFEVASSRAKVGAKERELSAALVEQLASDFTPEEFEDEYQAELRALIDEKLRSGQTMDTDATKGEASGEDDEAEDAEVIDLMEALKKSLDRKGAKSAQKAGGAKETPAKKSSRSSAKKSAKESA